MIPIIFLIDIGFLILELGFGELFYEKAEAGADAYPGSDYRVFPFCNGLACAKLRQNGVFS